MKVASPHQGRSTETPTRRFDPDAWTPEEREAHTQKLSDLLLVAEATRAKVSPETAWSFVDNDERDHLRDQLNTVRPRLRFQVVPGLENAEVLSTSDLYQHCRRLRRERELKAASRLVVRRRRHAPAPTASRATSPAKPRERRGSRPKATRGSPSSSDPDPGEPEGDGRPHHLRLALVAAGYPALPIDTLDPLAIRQRRAKARQAAADGESSAPSTLDLDSITSKLTIKPEHLAGRRSA